MDKNIISYKHKVGTHEQPAHAVLVPTEEHTPIWSTIKRDEHDKVCMSMGHVGDGAYVKIKVCNVSDIKAMLNDLHHMVQKFEEEIAQWEQHNPTHVTHK